MPAPSGTTRSERFLLSGYRGPPTLGHVTIRAFNRTERLYRALGALGQWWGVAILTVLVPVAHFVLVPGACLSR